MAFPIPSKPGKTPCIAPILSLTSARGLLNSPRLRRRGAPARSSQVGGLAFNTLPREAWTWILTPAPHRAGCAHVRYPAHPRRLRWRRHRLNGAGIRGYRGDGPPYRSRELRDQAEGRLMVENPFEKIPLFDFRERGDSVIYDWEAVFRYKEADTRFLVKYLGTDTGQTRQLVIVSFPEVSVDMYTVESVQETAASVQVKFEDGSSQTYWKGRDHQDVPRSKPMEDWLQK